MERRNFARGAPPPSHSWEWAGCATPPPDAPRKKEAARTAQVSGTSTTEKKFPWLAWLAGVGAAAAIGYEAGRRSRQS